jgi:uncharacterized protein YndB with AHSA1/START domain
LYDRAALERELGFGTRQQHEEDSMGTVSKSVEIPAPRQEVWDTVTDPGRFADWQTIHVGFAGDPPEQLSEGAEFKQKVTIMGMPGEIAWTVMTYENPSRLTLDGAGPMGTKATATFSLEDADEGTKFTYESGFEGAALAPLAGALEQQSAKAADESLEKLKALVS